MLLWSRLCTTCNLQSLASERIWHSHQKKLQPSCYKTWPHKTLNSLIQMLIWYTLVFVLMTWLPWNPTYKIIYNHARSVSIFDLKNASWLNRTRIKNNGIFPFYLVENISIPRKAHLLENNPSLASKSAVWLKPTYQYNAQCHPQGDPNTTQKPLMT